MRKRIQIMGTIIDSLNSICKIAFITYVWITMIRVNVYITKQEREK